MSKEELFKKYQEILLKTNGGADDYVVALCQISDLINDYAEEKSQQICDIEAKLKALQNGIIDDETLNMLVKEHKLYKDLEAKLAECEKKAYSRGHSQRDIANEIKLNALREDVANKEKRIVELKQQLAEKEQEIAYLTKQVKKFNNEAQKYFEDAYCNDSIYQDKISFAVDILEELAGCSNYINSKLEFECGSYVSEKAIRDKIKYLKGKKDE